MKRIVAVFLTIACMLFANSNDQYGTVTAEKTNLLKNAKRSSDVVQECSKGDQFLIIDEKGDYYKVKTGDIDGWIGKSDLAVSIASNQTYDQADTVLYDDPGLSPEGVHDGGDPELTNIIEPDRSFKNALKQDMDKESAGILK